MHVAFVQWPEVFLTAICRHLVDLCWQRHCVRLSPVVSPRCWLSHCVCTLVRLPCSPGTRFRTGSSCLPALRALSSSPISSSPTRAWLLIITLVQRTLCCSFSCSHLLLSSLVFPFFFSQDGALAPVVGTACAWMGRVCATPTGASQIAACPHARPQTQTHTPTARSTGSVCSYPTMTAPTPASVCATRDTMAPRVTKVRAHSLYTPM